MFSEISRFCLETAITELFSSVVWRINKTSISVLFQKSAPKQAWFTELFPPWFDEKIRQVYDWHKSSARTYWRRRRGGWAVRQRQQAIGGQCLVSILSNVRKEKETKMIGFSYYIMQSYMHTCNKTICSLPIVLYIPPARKRMSRLYRGVHKWRFDFLSWKIANSRICI